MFLRANTYRDVFIHFLIILAIAVILIMTFFYLYLPATTNHGETITVPNVVGMKLEGLDDFLEEKNLQYLINDSVYDANKPAHTVVLQSPLPDSKVKEGRKVYITVTTATPPNVKMPRLVGRSLINAQGELENNGLALGELKYVPDIQQNAVLKQQFKGKEITEGTDIPRGSKIDLVVGDGLGQQEFDVPNLIGKPLDEVEFELAGQGLQLGTVIYEPRPDKSNGTVFKQAPAPSPGRKIRVGDIVDIWVVGTSPESAPQTTDEDDNS